MVRFLTDTEHMESWRAPRTVSVRLLLPGLSTHSAVRIASCLRRETTTTSGGSAQLRLVRHMHFVQPGAVLHVTALRASTFQ